MYTKQKLVFEVHNAFSLFKDIQKLFHKNLPKDELERKMLESWDLYHEETSFYNIKIEKHGILELLKKYLSKYKFGSKNLVILGLIFDFITRNPALTGTKIMVSSYALVYGTFQLLKIYLFRKKFS